MKINMKKWLDETICSSRKKALPILSFPCAKLLNVSVKELLGNADLQAKGIKAIADKVLLKKYKDYYG